MPFVQTMNLVTKIVGAVHMFAAFLKVKDLGTGARIFMYKTLYIPLSKAFPFSGVLGYAPHPIGYMHLATALELAAGLCLLLGKSPKTKQRGCLMMMPLALLACHAFFPDDLALVAQSLLYLAGMCYLLRYHRRQTDQKVN